MSVISKHGGSLRKGEEFSILVLFFYRASYRISAPGHTLWGEKKITGQGGRMSSNPVAKGLKKRSLARAQAAGIWSSGIMSCWKGRAGNCLRQLPHIVWGGVPVEGAGVCDPGELI